MMYIGKKSVCALACLTLGLGTLSLSAHAAPVSVFNTRPAQTVAQADSPPGDDQMPDISSTTYILAPADDLDISVVGQPDLHQEVQVLADGTFNYPVVGSVKAAGLTVEQLTGLLTKDLSHRYNQPQVTVVVRQSHTRKINVTGAVRAPGLYDYRPGLRLLEVVSASGGPTQAAEQTQLTVISDGGAKSTPVDLVKLMNEGDPTQNIALSPGDSILFTPRDPATSMIQVVGEVGHAGLYPVVTGGATVLSLLTQAGGPTPSAALTKVQINHEGQVQTVDLHLIKYNLDDPAGKIKLVAGDTLLIPLNNAKYAVLGEVRAPSLYIYPDGESVTLTQALAEAGGPTSDGDQKKIGILRHDPSDIRSNKRLFIEVNTQDLLANKNTVNDPPIEPGDILIVPTRHHGKSLGDYLTGVGTAAYTAALLGTHL